MKVSELKVGQGKVDINLEVKSKGPVRSFDKFGKQLRVCNAEAVDTDGGKITLSLWNDDVEKIKEGDFIKVANGYVSEFNGQKQLGSGKFGTIEVVGADGESKDSAKESKPAPAKKPKKASEEELEEVEF